MSRSQQALGRAIRALRGARPQAQVAERAGVDPAVWSLYERGRRIPREANLRRILRGLECSRLELEEAAWQVRRRQLLRAQGEVGGEVREAEPPPGRESDRLLDEALDIARSLVGLLESLEPGRPRNER